MAQLLWLKNDLRLHDHAGFTLAAQSNEPLAVVYILPQAWLQDDAQGLNRLGAPKARFLQQCLHDVDAQLQAMGQRLQVFVGNPVAVLRELCERHHISQILTAEAPAPEEQTDIAALNKHGISVQTYAAQTLFTAAQLQIFAKRYPAPFTKFRIQVEQDTRYWRIAAPLSQTISHLPELLDLHAPSVDVFKSECHAKHHDLPIQRDWQHGGERAGLAWWQGYLTERHLDHYKSTRNQMLGDACSSKLSAYLAWGCLSVRQVWHDIVAYEAKFGTNQERYWLRFELLWREYFHWSMRHYGSDLFQYRGLAQWRAAPVQDAARWQAWCNAATGVPMVDAGLRELQQTGYVSNRLRQNMASYYVHQLQLDWRWGAAYFEQYLIDYDVASNYGNWAYLAGVGHDPRPQRQFNLNHQLRQYDPNLAHIRHWLPELNHVSLKRIVAHQTAADILVSYPQPVVAAPDGG